MATGAGGTTGAMADPCPICGRMDGGHDRAIHDAYEQGVRIPDGPVPKPVP